MTLPSTAYVVGIGASAGGVEALEDFFAGLPPSPGMAFILVTHLGPDRKSHMPEVLERHTSLPVLTMQDDMPIEINQVYVLGEDAEVSISEGRLNITSTSGHRKGRRPIDLFFTSLAKDQGQRAVGIVLSGSDSDGTLGLKAIKEFGGITMAQTSNGKGPAYAEMPGSAISAGIIDFAVPAAEMGARLGQLATDFDVPFGAMTADEDGSALPPEMEAVKAEIYELLLARTGHDFSGYKSKTFMRRVHRRMKVNQSKTLDGYLEFLRQTPQEAGALFRDLLISVTDFFRDPDAFEALSQQVIPQLLEGRGVADTVRVWVPGCATGEEVYSLAILLRERMDTMDLPPRVQLFATDIDERALSVARAARYPAALLDSVTPERRDRFFIADGESYIVSKQVRELCIFSPHNVLRDPPFSRIDLVSCRNLLIYFGGNIQKQVIPTFHYALRSGGYLFLGMSENTTQFSDMFGSVDKRHRIFQRRSEIGVRPRPHFSLPSTGIPGAQDLLQRRVPPSSAGLRQSIDSQVLGQYAPPHVLVNKDGDVVYYSGRTGKYLEAAAGVPTRQVLALARKDLRLDLRALLSDAIASGAAATRRNVAIEGEDGRVQLLRLTVDPLLDNREGEPLFLVLFSDDGPPVSREEANTYLHAKHTGMAEQIESELRETRDRLQSTIEEYETALEELKSSNEELVSVNEELQSSNEELEASKEELVSLNEELHTVNAELQGKVDELDRSNSDLHNLFESTAFATLFLDGNLVIRSFTPPVCEVFRILPSDRGRPITDLASRVPLPSFAQDIQEVFRAQTIIERRIDGNDDAKQYLLRLAPYRDSNNRVDGVVVTFIDITQITQAEKRHRILITELQHRTRNLLALVQSIAFRTLGRGEPFDRLNSRLTALSRVQELLSDGSLEAIDFAEIVRRELDAVGHGQHVSVQGEPTFVSAECSQSLALALHELGTNAVKHGALKHAGGQLAVHWHTQTQDDGKTLVIDWLESGLPTPPDAQRKGYGRELIEQALIFTLQARTTMDFQPDGLRCRIEVPLRPSPPANAGSAEAAAGQLD